MSKLHTAIETALQSTEANGIVLGYNRAAETIRALPLWEAESAADVLTSALTTAIIWADQDGEGEIQVAYGYRPDHQD